MATPSTGDGSDVVVRRISTLLRFLRSDTREAIPESDSIVALTATGTHFDSVLVPSCLANGGIQGFRWYWRELKIDNDGDIADEFFDDISVGEVHLGCALNEVTKEGKRGREGRTDFFLALESDFRRFKEVNGGK